MSPEINPQLSRTPPRPPCFSAVPDADWADWRWQLRNALKTAGALDRMLTLTADERETINRRKGALPLSITPYYAALIDANDPEDPIRKTMVPRSDEFVRSPGEREDPLGEEAHSPQPGIVHTYPRKVLFLATDHCATYCRYCTRGRLVGSGELPPERAQWEAGIAYIREHTEIEDVLISGGDPLTLSDDRLAWLLERLRAIPHVRLIRIGSKIPAVLPQRITPELVDVLSAHRPVWISAHFTHARELTPEVRDAALRLADAGIPVANQTVLLKGVNDSVEAIQALMEGLVDIHIRPYYLHQCDAIVGSNHFKTTVATGHAIIRGLHGHSTGYAVPTYMVDAPGGGGKVPLTPSYEEARDGDELVLRNYRGETYRYRDPSGSA